MESLLPTKDVIDSANAQFIGILLNWGLYGILVSQTCTYATTFSNDLRINKAIVYAVFSLETLQTAILTYDLYNSFVLHFGDMTFIKLIAHRWLAVPVLGGVAGLFYAWRIYKLSNSKWISGFVAIFSFAQFGAAIAQGLKARSAQNFSNLRGGRRNPLLRLIRVPWSITLVTCDVVVAVVMTYYLLKLRKEFYYDSSFFIRRLLTLTVETGSVTALAAIANGVLFACKPDSEAFSIPAFIIGKLYSNSLVRVLNSRKWTEWTAEVFTSPTSFESSTMPQDTRSKLERDTIS